MVLQEIARLIPGDLMAIFGIGQPRNSDVKNTFSMQAILISQQRKICSFELARGERLISEF